DARRGRGGQESNHRLGPGRLKCDEGRGLHPAPPPSARAAVLPGTYAGGGAGGSRPGPHRQGPVRRPPSPPTVGPAGSPPRISTPGPESGRAPGPVEPAGHPSRFLRMLKRNFVPPRPTRIVCRPAASGSHLPLTSPPTTKEVSDEATPAHRAGADPLRRAGRR